MVEKDKKDKKKAKEQRAEGTRAVELRIGEVPITITEAPAERGEEKKAEEHIGEDREGTESGYTARERRLWIAIVENASLYTIVKLLKEAPEYERLAKELVGTLRGEDEAKQIDELKNTLW